MFLLSNGNKRNIGLTKARIDKQADMSMLFSFFGEFALKLALIFQVLDLKFDYGGGGMSTQKLSRLCIIMYMHVQPRCA